MIWSSFSVPRSSRGRRDLEFWWSGGGWLGLRLRFGPWDTNSKIVNENTVVCMGFLFLKKNLPDSGCAPVAWFDHAEIACLGSRSFLLNPNSLQNIPCNSKTAKSRVFVPHFWWIPPTAELGLYLTAVPIKWCTVCSLLSCPQFLGLLISTRMEFSGGKTCKRKQRKSPYRFAPIQIYNIVHLSLGCWACSVLFAPSIPTLRGYRCHFVLSSKLVCRQHLAHWFWGMRQTEQEQNWN